MKFWTPTTQGHTGHAQLRRLRSESETSKSPVLALIDHGSEINLMSKEFYRKANWAINTNHGWKIRAATKATIDLFAACTDVMVKIGDVEICWEWGGRQCGRDHITICFEGRTCVCEIWSKIRTERKREREAQKGITLLSRMQQLQEWTTNLYKRLQSHFI